MKGTNTKVPGHVQVGSAEDDAGRSTLGALLAQVGAAIVFPCGARSCRATRLRAALSSLMCHAHAYLAACMYIES